MERAPHSEVLRHASAVVTHAGHGTVLKALAAGVPVVAIPLGRDQLDNAARVAHHGAGLRLKPKARPRRSRARCGACSTSRRLRRAPGGWPMRSRPETA